MGLNTFVAIDAYGASIQISSILEDYYIIITKIQDSEQDIDFNS